MNDLKGNTALIEEQKAYVAAAACKSEEEILEATARFAKQKGYEFEAEDLTHAKAAIREISDDELDQIAGGGAQMCAVNYGCDVVFNTCDLSNECSGSHRCNELTVSSCWYMLA